MLKRLSNNKYFFSNFRSWGLVFIAMGTVLAYSEKKVKNTAIDISRMAINTAKIDTLTIQQEVAAFGKPAGDTVFNLTNPLPEFRISIYNHVSKPERYSPFIKIRELRFNQKNNRQLYIWYRYDRGTWFFIERRAFSNSAQF